MTYKKNWTLRIGAATLGALLVLCLIGPSVALGVAVVAPTPAPVASGDTQAWWQAVLMPVLSVFGLFVAAFLAAGLRKLVILIEKKWNVDIPDSIETMMYEKARWAVAWAEEKAEKRLLYGDGKKTSGAQKIYEVVEILEKFAGDLGYGHDWQRDKIEALAEGVLHLERDATSASNVKRDELLAEKKADGDSDESPENGEG